MENFCKKILISGVVQGVFFRISTVEKARAMNVHGWIKNLPDGRVEVHAEGEATAVRDMLSWLHRGPVKAHVEHVSIQDASPGNYTNFIIL